MLIKLRKAVAAILIVSIGGLAMPAPAPAAMLSTDAVVPASSHGVILGFLSRPEVTAQLQARGVDPAEARARVAALSDDEAARLAGQIDSLPAGGDALGTLVWAALVVFIVLLITDLLGFTKVFPFTKPIR